MCKPLERGGRCDHHGSHECFASGCFASECSAASDQGRYDDRTITVYQAYSPAIAAPAVAAGRFVPPFSRDRMTWIKPSFLWMMYRSGWATKVGQERVLAITIDREGFEWALERSS